MIMSPIEASTIFATLVGLICNWKQERGSVATERFQDFLRWLTNHNFQALRSQIVESTEIEQALHKLLRQDSAILSQKLDLVCRGLSALSDRIEVLAPISHAINASREGALSDQAIRILKHFDQTDAERLILLDSPQPSKFALMPGTFYDVAAPKFLADDIASLEFFGLIRRLHDTYDGSAGMFTLTRLGSSYAAQIPDLESSNSYFWTQTQ